MSNATTSSYLEIFDAEFNCASECDDVLAIIFGALACALLCMLLACLRLRVVLARRYEQQERESRGVLDDEDGDVRDVKSQVSSATAIL